MTTFYTNTSGGLFVLPDGTEIPVGSRVPLSKDALENVGVSQMIAAGGLVADEKPRRTKPDAK